MYSSYVENRDKQKNPKYRFYHIPKAAGTAIFNMTTKWPNHKRAHPRINHVRIKDHPPKSDEISYAVIRHPYSRFTSAFYHLVDACNDDFYYKNATVSDCDWMEKKKISMKLFNDDPNEFLKALQEKIHPYHKIAQITFHHFDTLKPQFYWLQDRWGHKVDPRLNKILHHENIETEFQKIADDLGEYALWPRGKSANARISYNTTPLNDQSKAILRSLYKDDFKHFSFDT